MLILILNFIFSAQTNPSLKNQFFIDESLKQKDIKKASLKDQVDNILENLSEIHDAIKYYRSEMRKTEFETSDQSPLNELSVHRDILLDLNHHYNNLEQKSHQIFDEAKKVDLKIKEIQEYILKNRSQKIINSKNLEENPNFIISEERELLDLLDEENQKLLKCPELWENYIEGLFEMIKDTKKLIQRDIKNLDIKLRELNKYIYKNHRRENKMLEKKIDKLNKEIDLIPRDN
ncbi:hypothetical protein EDEG_03906 [Edhazardia aedis USNM 41457]|uniref:Uncharacterized protein n=1 Tax=Edhazardia aedis (strain USNM 41457) TaxID=1003232 RepID=J8ZP74_EDHAE|nr:hypothetical protein EDEG_03906 [Edhazardia aedis USNM 41457]|eukprot:EJW01513.1 hypothetical protein EDEG_03906 [Edhazardia aedis USNM 41457]